MAPHHIRTRKSMPNNQNHHLKLGLYLPERTEEVSNQGANTITNIAPNIAATPKNFASTISPWIVTTEALAPYRSVWTRVETDPQPMPYLESENNRATGSFDIQLQALIETEDMRNKNEEAVQMSQSNFKDSYWTVAQMVAHHTVNGCNLRAGDMFGSGTQSGPNPEEAGSMLELSNAGADPISLPNGEKRTFLEDGDNVIMKGWCQKDGAARIGFGSVSAKILPAS